MNVLAVSQEADELSDESSGRIKYFEAQILKKNLAHWLMSAPSLWKIFKGLRSNMVLHKAMYMMNYSVNFTSCESYTWPPMEIAI